MARKILKEEQRFQAVEVYLLLGLFTAWLLYKFVGETLIFQSPEGISLGTFALIMVTLAAIWWFVMSLRMYISVNYKGIKFRLSPFHGKKHKIKWSDIKSCEFVKTSGIANWSGWGVSTDPGEQMFSFCGRTGMYIETKDGQRLFIGSKRLYKKRDVIEKLIEKNKT